MPEGQPLLCAATTSGLQECMEEAHCTPVPHVLEDAVLCILREIGEDPNREVSAPSALKLA